MAVSSSRETTTNSKSNSKESKAASKSSKYSIPKVQKESNKGYLNTVIKGSRDESEILSAIKNSFLNRSFPLNWTVHAMELIVSPYLEERFHEKRRNIKSLYNIKEVEELFCFQVVNKNALRYICSSGLKVGTGDKICDLLGDPYKGVHLFKHADICLQSSSTNYVKLLTCKVITGKVKVIDTQELGVTLEPTPSFDCHVSRKKADPTCSLQYNIDKSKIYIYEYDDMCETVLYPRHCLPYAVVTFELKSWYTIPSKSKRNRDRICDDDEDDDDQPAEKILHRMPKNSEELEQESIILPDKINLNNIDFSAINLDESTIKGISQVLKMGKDSQITETELSSKTQSPPPSNLASVLPTTPTGVRTLQSASDIKSKQYSPLLITIKNTDKFIPNQQLHFDALSNSDPHFSENHSYPDQHNRWREKLTFSDDFNTESAGTSNETGDNRSFTAWHEKNISVHTEAHNWNTTICEDRTDNSNSYCHNEYGDVDYRDKEEFNNNPSSISDYIPQVNTLKMSDPCPVESTPNVNGNWSDISSESASNVNVQKTLGNLTKISDSQPNVVNCINGLVINVLKKKYDELSNYNDKCAVTRTISILQNSLDQNEKNKLSENFSSDFENRHNTLENNSLTIHRDNIPGEIVSIYSPANGVPAEPLFPGIIAHQKIPTIEINANRGESNQLDELSNHSDVFLQDPNQIRETINDDVSLVKTDSEKPLKKTKGKKSRKNKDVFHGRTLLKGDGVDARTIPILFLTPTTTADPRQKKESSLKELSLYVPDFQCEDCYIIEEGGKQTSPDVSVAFTINTSNERIAKKPREQMDIMEDNILTNFNTNGESLGHDRPREIKEYSIGIENERSMLLEKETTMDIAEGGLKTKRNRINKKERDPRKQKR